MLSDYEIYVRVVGLGSLSAAARAFGLSPALISKRLSRLEERLGVRLLQRTTRKVAMTDVGRDFYERAVGILREIEDTETMISGAGKATGGLLKISAPTSFGRMHLAPHLKPFLASHPGVRLQLDLTDDLVDLVAEGIDLAIRITPPVEGPLKAHALAVNHRVLCASPAYIDAHGEPRSLDDLARHTLLATANQTPWRLEGPSGPVQIPVDSLVRTNSNEVVREAVLAGVGVGLRSTWDVSEALSSGRLRTIMRQFRGASDIGIYALHPATRLVSPNVTAFIRYLTDLYGPVPYWDQELGIQAA